MIRRSFLALCLMTLSTPAAAQAVNIVWLPETRDNVGRSLAAQVRERLGSSNMFNLVNESDDVAALRANLITMQSEGDDGDQDYAIYALVVTMNFRGESFERYITQYVGECGVQVVQECATNIFNGLNEQAEIVRQVASRDQ